MANRSIQPTWPDGLPLKYKSPSGRRNIVYWVTAIVFISLTALLVGPYAGVRPHRFLYKETPPQQHRLEQVAISLNPNLHANRNAKILRFDWTVTKGVRAPDGVEKQVYLVNGGFPGPTIEARSGDRIIVHVHNELPDEGVSLHWHGLHMKGNNSMDGAVGVTQCPIPSGKDFIYDFTIGDDEHGTYWWHSHHKVQRGDGLFGGLVIHPPQPDSQSGTESKKSETAQEDYDDALLLIGDWFHRDQADVLEWYAAWTSLGDEPVPDSLQINGRGRFNCAMEMPAFPLNCTDMAVADMKPILARKSAKTRLRLVNVGTISGISLMVDGARLQPIEMDSGCAVEATPADAVGILYPGERADVMLSWRDNAKTEPWLNIYLDDENYARPNPALVTEQAFPVLPESTKADEFPQPRELAAAETQLDLTQLNATSLSATTLPPAEHTILFYMRTMIKSHLGNRPHGYINDTSWEPQSTPLLAQGRKDWDKKQMFPFIPTGSKPAHVDIVINNLDDGSHPVHLHGHSFYVLSSFRAKGKSGWGSYNPYLASGPPSPLNMDNPPAKDTVSVPRRGHVVLRVLADNPGLWVLHCHMMVHMGTGMAAGLHVGSADDDQHLSIDSTASTLCDK